LLYKQG